MELANLPSKLGLDESEEMIELRKKYLDLIINTEDLSPAITQQAAEVMDQYKAAAKEQNTESPNNLLLPIALSIKEAEINYLISDKDNEYYIGDLGEIRFQLQQLKENPDFGKDQSNLDKVTLIEDIIRKAVLYLYESMSEDSMSSELP